MTLTSRPPCSASDVDVLERSLDCAASPIYSEHFALAKNQEFAFENILEVFYSLLTDC